MSEATVSEEQVLHNELSFEINQELIHLMKRIVEIQQENKKYKDVIDKAIEFTNKKWGTWCTHHLEYMTELQNILKEGKNE